MLKFVIDLVPVVPMSGVDVVAGLVLGAIGIVPALKKGYSLVQGCRRKRMINRLFSSESNTSQLAGELSTSELTVKE